jgi:hypothetical protein
MKITTNTEPEDELRDAAVCLLNAASAYHKAYSKAGLRAAVVWVQDSSDRLVIITRGEYADELMYNINKVAT